MKTTQDWKYTSEGKDKKEKSYENEPQEGTKAAAGIER